MRKLLAIALVGALLVAVIPGAALAGDRHSGSNVAAGIALGAAAAVVGGILLNALTAPAIAPPVAYVPPPPVVYAPAPPVIYAPPPPIVYAPAPPVVYMAPPVVYKRAPAVAHRYWTPRGHSERWRHQQNGGWDRR